MLEGDGWGFDLSCSSTFEGVGGLEGGVGPSGLGVGVGRWEMGVRLEIWNVRWKVWLDGDIGSDFG